MGKVHKYFEKTIDLEVHQLCSKIDEWKEAYYDLKEKYEKLEKDYSLLLDSSLKYAQQTTGAWIKALLDREIIINDKK